MAYLTFKKYYTSDGPYEVRFSNIKTISNGDSVPPTSQVCIAVMFILIAEENLKIHSIHKVFLKT
jgi:hypothetical protein